MNEFDRETFRPLLAAFIKRSDVTVPRVAQAIGCSEPTLRRVLAGKTLPSDGLMKEGETMFDLGFVRYSKLSASERGNVSEKVGAATAGAFGFAAISGVIEDAGVKGLSAPGISSGLARLGRMAGGGMVRGVMVAAAIPLAAGALGYQAIKEVKNFASMRRLNSTEIDDRWEIVRLNEPDGAQ